jgi:sodium/hydrogen exchanger 8
VQLCYLSGILTVFFCGIVMSHYTWHNVTEASRIATKHSFATMSFIAETFIFLYVGMDALDVDKWRMSKTSVGEFLGLFGILLLLVLVGRAAFVFPLSALSNYWTKSPTTKISLRHQVPTANLCMDGCFLIESFLLCGMCSFVTHCKFGLRDSNTRVELFMKS